MCWSVAAAATLVVVMGTQHFDAAGLGGADYPVADLLQMLGRASRPLQDDAGAPHSHSRSHCPAP